MMMMVIHSFLCHLALINLRSCSPPPPVSSICNVIEAVLEHLGNVTVDCLPDPRTVSYFAYELGIISDLQVGEIL